MVVVDGRVQSALASASILASACDVGDNWKDLSRMLWGKKNLCPEEGREAVECSSGPCCSRLLGAGRGRRQERQGGGGVKVGIWEVVKAGWLKAPASLHNNGTIPSKASYYLPSICNSARATL